ncbi:MAG: T9SS type A sorting domain-containing protein [Bacteroidota bacterium]
MKHYFTNGNHYLRGIRIDSTTVQGSNFFYYPFHTQRFAGSQLTNINNGSWLGYSVIQLSDGTFLFDNMWGDTVIIKTQASVGSTWTFYNDTSSRNYIATVTAVDTMTVLGNIDSIKKITISAYNGSTAAPSDAVNNFQLILSKNYGFVQIFDLFTFPYRRPDTSFYQTGLDYHLDTVCRGVWPAGPNYNNSIFKIIDYKVPTFLDMFNYNIGDIFETEYSYNINDNNQTTFTSDMYIVDTIVGKTIVDPYHTHYDTKRGMNRTETHILYNGINYPTIIKNYYMYFGPIGYDVDTSQLAHTDKIPEEYGLDSLIYYNPKDTSNGYTGLLYYLTMYPNPNYIEWCPTQYNFKAGSYPINMQNCATSFNATFPYDEPYDTILRFTVINGVASGNYIPLNPRLGVNDIKENEFKLYPNPANEIIHIQFNKQENCTVSIINMMGQALLSEQCNGPSTTIPISDIPTGIYDVRIQIDNGTTSHQKIVIQH